ncbi:CD209 antigen-like protein C DC-SIGN-related protein 2 [Takifugu flavidus]|uniref:CD209 antigen-like protein C DC-SIGN-related protein 2 n=1 Tax=Takifugu flavidus TaxID=433684 RepID=A0A5C6NZC2_9TELE|nr:CD209 antigen-like protein C DC-SIGN-related protein 2 [Takifugu flavidus]
MENFQRRNLDSIKGQFFHYLESCRQGAKARQGSLHDTHAAAAELLGGLDDLMSNHSNVVEARDTAKSALDTAVQNHAQMKKQITELKVINDKYQRQMEAMEKEKASLKANYTALVESCGCPSRWTHFMSSCYLFSTAENQKLKKNWDDSREDCIRREADLVIVDSPEEQTFVSHNIESLIGSKPFWDSSFWLGLRDTEIEGTWVWLNNVTEVEQSTCQSWIRVRIHGGREEGPGLDSDVQAEGSWVWICNVTQELGKG